VRVYSYIGYIIQISSDIAGLPTSIVLDCNGDKWVPADFFYASPDYDLVPNYAIGRIPVNNLEEAEHVVQKIKSFTCRSGLKR